MINANINGKTVLYGVIGDPVAHSFSPQIHNTLAKRLGDDLAYCAFHVGAENLERAVLGAQALGIRGLNVTVPHKPSVMSFLTYADRTALEAGSANTLLFSPDGIRGYNTDIAGLTNTFKAHNVVLSGRKVVVLGAGGSSRAAAIAVAKGGCSEICLVNRTVEKAEAVAEQIRKYYPVKITALRLCDGIPKADILINTTTVGLGSADASPVSDNSCLAGLEFLLDIIYSPWETQLIKDARGKGAACVNGFEMLVYQAVASYEIWKGEPLEEGFISGIIDELRMFYLQTF